MSEYSITPQSEEESSPDEPAFDQTKYEQMMQDVRLKQSLTFGILGGLLASLVAAVIWGLISYVTNFQIGFMAIGVGFLVGYAVRYCGSGVTMPFGIAGAVLSLFGCILGNLFMAMIVISRSEDVSLPLVFLAFLTSPGIVLEIYAAIFSPIDLLFYGIAVYEGYRFSFYQLTDEEVAAVRTPPPPPVSETKKQDE